MLKVFKSLLVVVVICITLCSQPVEAKVGISLGSGLAIPTGSFNIGPNVGDAKTGPIISLGIDVYPKENISVGIFGRLDILGAGQKAVLPISQEYLDMFPDATPDSVESYGTVDAGGVLKYFWGNSDQWYPYGKMWIGISSGTVAASKDTVDGDPSLAYGIGFGVMRKLSDRFQIYGDINYDRSKIDKNDTEANSSRVSIGVALNLIIGRTSEQ